MNLHLFIAAPFKRLPKAQPIPSVECSEADARSFFAGWWQGIGVGFVIGVALAVVAIR